jgi:quinol monooxygenase YgiN
MSKLGLLLILEAKPGKEKAVEELLTGALSLAISEHNTVTWYAFRIKENKFGVFDTFSNEEGRTGHLSGQIAKQLMAKAPELFANQLNIERLDILAAK